MTAAGWPTLTSSPTVTNCTFSGNAAVGNDGGGINNEANSHPMITNCTFSDNSAYDWGGAVRNIFDSSPTFTNCIFIGNSADEGGGLYNYENSNPTLTNCTFSANTAAQDGGGMANAEGSNPTVTNCILWGDTPDEVDDVNSSTTVTYSDVQGGYAGTGNINADPLFVDAAGGDWRLVSPASPCVDAGDNNAVTVSTDLAGNPRVVDGDRDGTAVVDMGAYELLLLQMIHNITQDTWYGTIQAAINEANGGDEIEVLPGTYNEVINFSGKAVRLYSSGGPEVTVIDASGAGSVVSCITGEGPNTVLNGFTITGGYSMHGGGMFNESSSPTVMNCIFTFNDAEMGGGGMANMYFSSPIVRNCTFDNNLTYVWHNPEYPLEPVGGGGIINVINSSPTVTDCIFRNNVTPHRGGGMANIEECSPIVTNCMFIENWTTDFYMGDPPVGGGGMYNTYSEATVTNCTFFMNETMSCGGGLHNIYGTITLSNCILWSDFSGEPGCNEIFDGGGISANYCDIQGGWFGTGNINSDPLFLNAVGGDLRLSPGSACIDAGDNTAVPGGVTTDLNGFPRFIDDLCAPDTGNGTAPVVDMGAYEYLPADIDSSGAVDLRDFSEFALQWLKTGCGRCGGANMTCDGNVDWNDLRVLTDWWLTGTEPEL